MRGFGVRGLVTAIVVLTGAAILRGGAAAADPNQDDEFLALLNKEDIPALEGLMETVILLRMTGPRSIKAVQDWISVNADHDDTTARKVIASLPSLATGEGWVWSPRFLHERAAFPIVQHLRLARDTEARTDTAMPSPSTSTLTAPAPALPPAGTVTLSKMGAAAHHISPMRHT